MTNNILFKCETIYFSAYILPYILHYVDLFCQDIRVNVHRKAQNYIFSLLRQKGTAEAMPLHKIELFLN